MRLLIMAIVLAGIASPAAAQRDEEGDIVLPRLVAEHLALVPGEQAWLGLTFQIREGWHLYWNGLSDSGGPILIKLSLPAGYVQDGTILWPAPRRYVLPGDILDHIYEKRVTLLVPVQVPPSATPGSTAEFAADLEWLVCREICLPGQARVVQSLPVAETARPSPDAPLFRESRARLPVPPPPDEVAIRRRPGALTLTVRGAAWLAFYPMEGCARLTDPIADGQAEGERLRLRMRQEGGRVVGVLEVRRDSGESRFWLIDTARNDQDERKNPGP